MHCYALIHLPVSVPMAHSDSPSGTNEGSSHNSPVEATRDLNGVVYQFDFDFTMRFMYSAPIRPSDRKVGSTVQKARHTHGGHATSPNS